MPSFNFFLGVVSEIEIQSFPIFPTWLPHYVTYDVIIIIKTFRMSSRTNGEIFVVFFSFKLQNAILIES